MKLREKVHFLINLLKNLFANLSKPVWFTFLLCFVFFYLVATLVLAPGLIAIYLCLSLLLQILWWLSDIKSEPSNMKRQRQNVNS